jgi:hypothetical protein
MFVEAHFRGLNLHDDGRRRLRISSLNDPPKLLTGASPRGMCPLRFAALERAAFPMSRRQ